MSFSKAISRLAAYFKRHGLAATIFRARLAVKRALFADRMVILYCDLVERRLPNVNAPTVLKVERLRALTELRTEHLQAMTSFWNPKLANQNIRERFEKGASLWLIECQEQLAGYGWTFQGSTIEPYYFPLAQDDVHLFDFYMFPDYRGQGMNPYLIGGILNSLTTGRGRRAFIEVAEWNSAQLSSLRKTPFRRLGSARSLTIFGYTFVSWTKDDTDARIDNNSESVSQTLETARSNEH
jgi:hypothetical protein